jgi:hypothetical protein
LEACTIENQGQLEFEKRKTIHLSSSRPPIIKKKKRSKSRHMFNKKGGSSSQNEAPVMSFQGTSGGHTSLKTSITLGFIT